MKTKHLLILVLAVAFLCVPLFAQAAPLITDKDSTQPRGFGGPEDLIHPDQCKNGGHVYNDQRQDLCPVTEGFRSPFWHVYNADQGSQLRYFDWWKGMMMGNAARDPSFFATLSVANKDFVNLLLAAVAYGIDKDNPDLEKLVGLKTARQVACALKIYEPSSPDPCERGNPITLLPEDKRPVTADICLRCHFTAGWMEGRSEPSSPHFPYLKGQFWGAAFKESNVCSDSSTGPCTTDSEADMEGIQCGFCHRAKDNYKRYSLYDGSKMAAGSGGYFVFREDPLKPQVRPTSDFQKDSSLCGTCHDVTNPLVYTQTTDAKPMKHPIERTYTEWYWSQSQDCKICHVPMAFQGAQTWMIYPGLDSLWGAVDQKWGEEPFNYSSSAITPFRTQAYMDARDRSEELMKSAARLEIVSAGARRGTATVKVKITNNTGHKLPTGFAEGRQMWIHLVAKDSRGNVLFETGKIVDGELVRDPDIKVYEQVVLAKGYDTFNLAGTNGCESWNILDYTTGEGSSLTWTPTCGGADGVSHYDKEFHFVLMNYIEKDNRIPPAGFNKAAYIADGAFIVPFGPKDTDYSSGQNYDETTYTFPVQSGTIYVTATLKYQTFNKEYIEFLKHVDTEMTQEAGGRARNMPCNEGSQYCGQFETWGALLEQIWIDADNGKPVEMATASRSFTVR